MSLGVILVVEDDDAIRRGIADALSYSGYTVHDAPDGASGLELILGTDADLVLLDIMMPKMDGHEVLTRLRRAKPAQPVIFLTARGEEYDRIKGLKLGADDYIVKPFSIDELIARIEAVLRRSPGRPTSRSNAMVAGRGLDPRGTHTRTVDMTIARLRETLDDEPGDPQVIKTVRGKGYMLVAPDDAVPEAEDAS
jgi:DNA-binding response OmpR family regulator